MTDTAQEIRNGVRAVIVRNGCILLLRKVYEDHSERFVLPGGSQDPGETLEEALQRECLEEIGTEVTIQGLLYLADFFKPRSTQPVTYRQQVEFLLACQVPDDYKPGNGHRPDRHQSDVIWADVAKLDQLNLFPSGLRYFLGQTELKPQPIYIGRIKA